MAFEAVAWKEWRGKLRGSETDAQRNPSRKLLGFWEEQKRGRRDVKFVTKAAEDKSEALRRAEGVVEKRYVKDLLEAWRDVW